MSRIGHLFLTGATGLIGSAVLGRLLEADPHLTATVLARRPDRLGGTLPRKYGSRVTILAGDLERPNLGLPTALRRELSERCTHVMHAAANTRFSQAIESARRTNRDGTRHVLEALAGAKLERFLFVSTAFAAGTLKGEVPERPLSQVGAWVNAYEQSKHEAEELLLGADVPLVIARSSTVVCDDTSGCITQFNAVHRALHLFHSGLAAMLPGGEETGVDVVTTEYVADALVKLLHGPRPAEPSIVHLCAGANALGLGQMLDLSRAVWSECGAWRSRRIERPSLTTLANYRLFERSVAETGDARVRAITRGLSTFVPQLAHPKRFDTRVADRLLGFTAPPVSEYWGRMCRTLVDTGWGRRPRRAS